MAVPSPQTWANGGSTNAVTFNREFRDPINWLMGSTRPTFHGQRVAALTLSTTKPMVCPIDQEDLKRGSITHSASASRITVGESGYYSGSISAGVATGGACHFTACLLVNGVVIVTQDNENATQQVLAGVPFSIPLVANDYVELGVTGDYAGGGTQTWGAWDTGLYPRISITWRSK